MNIEEFKNHELNIFTGYITGLIYPLYKEKMTPSGDKYLIGSINHNNISEENLANHFKKILNLKNCFNLDILIKNNSSSYFKISPKKGFSILIEINSFNESYIKNCLTQKVQEIKQAQNDIKKAFARGCFDGRGSWDTTAHFFSVDCDRDHKKQELIQSIFEDLKISLQLNQRDINHKKNDQLRIRPNSINRFLTDIGLYSQERINILEKGIKEI